MLLNGTCFKKTMFRHYNLYLIALICNLIVCLINKLQFKIYFCSLVFCCKLVCECILFRTFCFEIRQLTDMKIENNSVNALSTDKLLSNIRSNMIQILLYKTTLLTSNAFTRYANYNFTGVSIIEVEFTQNRVGTVRLAMRLLFGSMPYIITYGTMSLAVELNMNRSWLKIIQRRQSCSMHISVERIKDACQ